MHDNFTRVEHNQIHNHVNQLKSNFTNQASPINHSKRQSSSALPYSRGTHRRQIEDNGQGNRQQYILTQKSLWVKLQKAASFGYISYNATNYKFLLDPPSRVNAHVWTVPPVHK